MGVTRETATDSQAGRATPEASAGGLSAEVGRLVAAGKCKQAVELAKTEHKRSPTAESERLLVEAYLARIEQFQRKGAAEDAQVLINLVRGRFPRHQRELVGLQLRGAAVAGKIDELVAPLADPSLPRETKELIETAIRQHVVDLRGLANTTRLGPDHPLRAAAAAAWRAFEAVTTGPVRAEQIELPEISRRGPLAPWKLLVRAIDAFYRGDDLGCRRALDAIPQDAAVHRLVPVLTQMLEGSAPGPGLAGALQARLLRGDSSLPDALEQVERALSRLDLPGLKRSIRAALQACAAARPDQCERLRQHISVRCMVEEAPVEHVREATGRTLRDAYFWRLMARAAAHESDFVGAALYWDRFVRHAVSGGWFAADSLEAAVVYQEAAELLAGVPRRLLEARRRRANWFNVLREYYAGQPPEIAALAPHSEQTATVALDPNYLFEKAAQIHPSADLFKKWWNWTIAWDLPKSGKERVLELWRQKLPRDPEPLLRLSEMAEARRALQLALKYLTAAEAIDPASPRVRKARVRLTLAVTWKHFSDGNLRLVSLDLAELEALPAMGEPDRVAFLLTLRGAIEALRQNWAAARQAGEAVLERVGPLAAWVLAESVGRAARLSDPGQWPILPKPKPSSGREAAEAIARLAVLAQDLGFPLERPPWDKQINKFLKSTKDPLPPARLLALGRAALAWGNKPQAYLASAAGLRASTGAAAAPFLLLRARSLTEFWQRRRALQCLRAALDLAQQANDADLMDQITQEMDRHSAGPLGALGRGAGRGLDEKVLAEILEQERRAAAYPTTAFQADLPVVHIEGESPFNPFDLFPGEDDEQDGPDFDDADDDADDDDGGLFSGDIPVSALPVLTEVLSRYGRIPPPQELMRDDPELARRLGDALHDMISEHALPSPLDLIGRVGARGRPGKKKKRR